MRCRWMLLPLWMSAAALAEGRSSSGLVALYPCDEGSGAVVHDVADAGTELNLLVYTWDAGVRQAAEGTWTDGGLSFATPGLALGTDASSAKIKTGFALVRGFTVEAWVTPGPYETALGPARVAAYSKDVNSYAFALGQLDNAVVGRVVTSLNSYELTSPALVSRAGPQHWVLTATAPGKARLYVNGIEAQSADIVGDFSTWNPAFSFKLGDEVDGFRYWLGEIHLVALYARALTAAEIQANLFAGPDTRPSSVSVGGTVDAGSSPSPGTDNAPSEAEKLDGGTLFTGCDCGAGGGGLLLTLWGVLFFAVRRRRRHG